jgi:glycosyltransferase involved in cell wall biosynthesis
MKGADKPKVSLGMPVYNGEPYITEAIESVLNQTYQDFELIVSDNCSTDNTSEIIRKINDSRIRYYRNEENIGVVPNFNRTVELSRGQYFCLWAHDDVMLPTNLEQKVTILDRHQQVGFVHSDVELIDSNGTAIDKKFFSESRSDYIDNGMDFFNRYILKMHQGASIFLGAVLARKECFDRLGAFNPQLPIVCDSDMWMKFSLFYDVACVAQPLIKYRIHQSMTSTSILESTGFNLKGFEEHYLSTQIMLDTYSRQIPNAVELKDKIKKNFASQVLKSAGLNHLDNSQRYEYLMASMKFNPSVLLKKRFWKVLMKNVVSPRSSAFYC